MEEDEDYTCDMTEDELFELTERLLDNDENNCAKYFRYNFQERRCGEEDVCDEPLFSDVDEALFEVPTVKTLMALHDNYVPVSLFYTENHKCTGFQPVFLFFYSVSLKKRRSLEKKSKKSKTSSTPLWIAKSCRF